MTIIELFNRDNEPDGLFVTTRTDVENFQSDFDEAFENIDTDSEDFYEELIEWLSAHKDITRVWSEGVITDKI